MYYELFRSTSLFANGILIAVLLTECQQENDTTPTPESARTVTNDNAKTIAVPLMVKNGTDLMEYGSDALGRQKLKKVTLTA